jgi:hypothetical protein
MKTLKPLLLILLIFNCAPKASAFGPAGHKIVVDIAMQYLSPNAKAKVLQILGNVPPDSAAVWMDAMRSDSSYTYMKPWHFINIDKGKAYDPSSTNNIIWELNRVYAELQHPEKLSPAVRKQDVMILIHLMGDLHQPLHVGYGSDRGGNEVKVDFKGFHTDLHSFWDSELIWNQHVTVDACMKLSKTSAQALAKTKFTTDQFVAYMKESRSLLPKVYAFSGGVLDQTYATNNKPVVELQLLRGGQRLAIVLNQLFGA